MELLTYKHGARAREFCFSGVAWVWVVQPTNGREPWRMNWAGLNPGGGAREGGGGACEEEEEEEEGAACCWDWFA